MSEQHSKQTEQRKGRPPSASAHEIIQAGSALEEQGKPVTGHALRKQLGNRGRPDYLLRQWQDHRASDGDKSTMSQTILPSNRPRRADQEKPTSDDAWSPTTEPPEGALDGAEDTLNAIIVSRLTASLERAMEERGKLEAAQMRLQERLQGAPSGQSSNARADVSPAAGQRPSPHRHATQETAKSSESLGPLQEKRAYHAAHGSKQTHDENGGLTSLLQRLEEEWTAVGRLRTQCHWLRRRLNKACNGSHYSTNATKHNASNKKGSPQAPASNSRAKAPPSKASAQKTKRQQTPTSQNQQTRDWHNEGHATLPATAAVERTRADTAPLHDADAHKRNPTSVKQKPVKWRILKQTLDYILHGSVRI